jgi:hypothetical protein
MAQFLGDIAFAAWAALLAGGLIAWHIGTRDAAGPIKSAAVIMIVAGLGGGVCTTYYWFSYHSAGAFESAYPASMSMQGMSSRPMMQRMMQNRMPADSMRPQAKPGQMDQMPMGQMPMNSMPENRMPDQSDSPETPDN